MTKKAEKSIRKTIYRHPVGALRVFCSVMLLALLGVCGYAGSARTKNVPSAVSLPVIRTELEGDAIGGGSIAEVRARLNRQREEELALLDGVIADAGGDSAAKEAALAQKTQIAERMEREAQMTAVLEGMGAEGALAATAEGMRHVSGFSVATVDTTGAGDAFWGGFLHRMLALGKAPEELTLDDAADCARWGNATAALCVTKRGAIPAMPSLAAVEALLAE